MIFVTTGTQLAFPRLIAAMDALAPVLGEHVVAQIGPDTGPHANLDTHATLTPARFEALFAQARVIVAHAGIGTILSARRHAKPLILVPRRFAHGEHRNDHQMATAREVEGRPGIHVAWETGDLARLLQSGELDAPGDERNPAAAELMSCLRAFVDGS